MHDQQTQGSERKRAATAYLTVADIATRWSMSQRYVWRLVWDGKLPSKRFGRAVRVALQSVEEFEAKA